MSAGEIIILIGYVIGVIFTIKYQQNKISSLETQIGSQAGIMNKMVQFMNIFKVEELEKYVGVIKKRVQTEKEDTIKEIESQWKQKVDSSTKLLMEEYIEVSELVYKLVGRFPLNPETERFINEMKEGTVAKKKFKDFWEHTRKQWETVINRWESSLATKKD